MLNQKGGDRMCAFLVALLLWGTAAVAGEASGPATITDADTITVGGTKFRLDGIDAPEIDQTCRDANGAEWPCGVAARDALAKLTGGLAVRCQDVGADSVHPDRRIGICSVGEIDINGWLVREGWAVNFELYAKGRFKAAEDEARANRRGMWAGCFIAPQDFRRWNKRTAPLLGLRCPQPRPTSGQWPFEDKLPPPQGCEIKGRYGKLAYPWRGIYHLPGCRSYRTLGPQRWFYSEAEARDAGFRKAFTCFGKG